MALKKQHFSEGEIAIFKEDCIYKQVEYWQFRMWLPEENKYTRKCLQTPYKNTALKEAKCLCKEFGFTAGMLKNVLADSRKRQ